MPQQATDIEDLAGEWMFVDDDGVTSTVIIDETGQFAIDRAPEEAFRVQGGGAGFYDWEGTIYWARAQTVSGDAVIDQTGRVLFATQDPEWGASAAYQVPLQRSLQFFIGNVDNGDTIVYERIDEG